MDFRSIRRHAVRCGLIYARVPIRDFDHNDQSAMLPEAVRMVGGKIIIIIIKLLFGGDVMCWRWRGMAWVGVERMCFGPWEWAVGGLGADGGAGDLCDGAKLGRSAGGSPRWAGAAEVE